MVRSKCFYFLLVLLSTSFVSCVGDSEKNSGAMKGLGSKHDLHIIKIGASGYALDVPDIDKKGGDDEIEPPSLSVFGIGVQVFLLITGMYTCLCGFRAFRLLMIILGFYCSYYTILFTLKESGVVMGNSLPKEISVFAGALVLGLLISAFCYTFEKLNFAVFGASVGVVMGLFYYQFFVEFDRFEDRITLLALVLGFGSLVIIAAYFVLDSTIIVGSSLVGAIIAPISLGILLKRIDSFESRGNRPSGFPADALAFQLASGLLFISGLISQFYLRKRIINRFQEENLEQIRGESFLN